MKWIAIALLVVLCISAPASGLEKRARLMRDDFGIQALTECILQYYYFIPCPTYSWFWEIFGWGEGDVIGVAFTVGDFPTGDYTPCDSVACYKLIGARVLDFEGFGQAYPGLFTIEFDVYCANESDCPAGPSLWNSGPFETARGWNEIVIDPPLDLSSCYANPGPPASTPRFLLTATHTGTDHTYPGWGFDNIGTHVTSGCVMHAYGCLPADYPRPYLGHYTTMHTGYYGTGGAFQHCPPELFVDALDTTIDGSQYGFIELAWRVHMQCEPDATDPTTWSRLKSMFK